MTRRAVACVFAAGAVVRLLWLAGQGPEPRFAMTPDSPGYVRLALNLRERAVFSMDGERPYVPDTFRTPGYPAFLSLFKGPRGAQWAQAALGAAACALVSLAAASLGAPAAGSAVAGLLLAVDLASVASTGQILTDAPFQFLLALALWLAARGRWAMTGLALGAAALTRPLGLYLPLPLAAVAALVSPRGERRRAAALLLATALVLPAAWIARNKARTGVATFSSLQGLNALVRAASAHAQASGKPYERAYAELDAAMRAAHGGPFASDAEEGASAGLFAAGYLLRHPLAYARVCAGDAARLFGGHALDVAAWALLKDSRYDPMAPDVVTGGFRGTRQLLERHPAFKAALAAYWAMLLVCYALAARGLWTLYRARSWDAAALCAVPIAYFLALTLGMGVYYRLRLPLMPPLLILAAFGLKPKQRVFV